MDDVGGRSKDRFGRSTGARPYNESDCQGELAYLQQAATLDSTFIAEHGAIVPASAYFPPIKFRGQLWDLSHLQPFALKRQLRNGAKVDVVVFFSCHCFTHKVRDDPRDEADIPDDECWNDDEKNLRVLDENRYRLSKALPGIFQNFDQGHVRMLPRWQDPVTGRVHKQSFCKVAVPKPDGTTEEYVLFFTLDKDVSRKRRFILRVKSAYAMAAITKTMGKAQKVRFMVLLNAKFDNVDIRG